MLLSVVFFLTIAYIKVRYTTQIFKVQSSLLIQNDMVLPAASPMGAAPRTKIRRAVHDARSPNLSNEIEVLKSTPVLQRVARDLNLQAAYYSRGNVRGKPYLPDVSLHPEHHQKSDMTKGIDFTINLLSADRYTIDEGKTVYHFGDTLSVGDDHVQLIRHSETNIFSFASRKFEIDWSPPFDAALSLQGKV